MGRSHGAQGKFLVNISSAIIRGSAAARTPEWTSRNALPLFPGQDKILGDDRLMGFMASPPLGWFSAQEETCGFKNDLGRLQGLMCPKAAHSSGAILVRPPYSPCYPSPCLPFSGVKAWLLRNMIPPHHAELCRLRVLSREAWRARGCAAPHTRRQAQGVHPRTHL